MNGPTAHARAARHAHPAAASRALLDLRATNAYLTRQSLADARAADRERRILKARLAKLQRSLDGAIRDRDRARFDLTIARAQVRACRHHTTEGQ